MNKRIPVLLVTLFLAQSCLKSLAQSVPTKMNYQGVIANSSGVPLASGTYDLTFRIYNAATGPTLIWGPQTIPVAVVSGQFNVALGPLDAATPTPRALSAGFASATSYLEIQVGANPPIVPRQQILSAPFAFEADHAATLGGSSGTPLITSSGNSVTVAGPVTASSFTGSGAGLTGLTASQIPNLDAGKITTGTIDARLSSNVALLNRSPQAFSGAINTFDGKVGIGAAPGEKLHVTGGNIGMTPNAAATSVALLLTDSGYSVKGQLAIAGTPGALSSDAAANDIVFRAEPGGKLLLQSGGPGNTGPSALAISAANKVGIGTTSPGGLLDIRNNSGANESLRLSGAAFNAIQGTSTNGISFLLGLNRDDLSRTDLMIGNSRKLAATDSVIRIIPGLGSLGSLVASTTRDGSIFTDLGLQDGAMVIKANGDVGIGVANPTKAKLEINGASGNFSLTTTFREYSKTSVGGLGALPNSTGVNSIYASGRLTGQDFIAFSDERIKRVEGHSDPARDLAMLQGIEVTDYAYIDTVAKGPGKHKKVIAQQVEKVFPQAVSKSTDVVPDIYQKAVVKDGWVELATNLKKGERVRLIGEKKEGIHEVLEVAEGRFRTEFKPEGDKVFVFGREVKDFRSVDYEAISMLNVSATQQLARRLEKQAAELAARDAKIATLEKAHVELKQALAAQKELANHLQTEFGALLKSVARLADRSASTAALNYRPAEAK